VREGIDRGRGAAGAPPSRRPVERDRSADFEKDLAGLPPIPEDADPNLLDRGVRAELRSLSKLNADAVGRYLVAAGQSIDIDPRRALLLARAARARAARVAAVREAVGVAAYQAEEWAEALTELRTARRISGDPRNLPLIADCERALGRPEQAARVLSDPDVRRLDGETRVELLIVVAGARRDVGQLDAALSVLARGSLDKDRPGPGAARLWYAYADALEAAGRTEEAATWFAASAARDPEGELDSVDRAAALL
jgi:tetratricopeptide (TPR) repeat protein